MVTTAVFSAACMIGSQITQPTQRSADNTAMPPTAISIFQGAPPDQGRVRRLALMRVSCAASAPPPKAALANSIAPHATQELAPPTSTTPTTTPDRALVDAHALAILDEPLQAGEGVQAGFARKERELAELIATLGAHAALAMQARLIRNDLEDELAAKFARLAVDRRGRLINHLADVARRDARTRPGHR